MARQLRIEYPGAYYHVTARGNERKEIFKSETDREKFLSYLESAVKRYGAVIHVWCLMSNHYHLLVETPSGNLSRIMQHINGAYTNYFNTKRKRSGHLFQGRYKGILVEADEYALELSRYIHLNPVRIGIVKDPSDYKWSSFQDYAGKKKAPDWLTMTFILGYFDKSQPNAHKKYSQSVEEMIGKEHESPLQQMVASTMLGTPEFVAAIQEQHLGGKSQHRNLPALKQLRGKPTIDRIYRILEITGSVFNQDEKLAAKVAIYLCHRYSGAKLKEIGDRFGVKESAVSQSSKRFEVEQGKAKKLQVLVTDLVKRLNLCNV
jgi:REP element-mobilizing transposase RayT